jgi:hypothetical protein
MAPATANRRTALARFLRRLIFYALASFGGVAIPFAWEALVHGEDQIPYIDRYFQYWILSLVLLALVIERWRTLGVLWSVWSRGLVVGLGIVVLVGASYGWVLSDFGFYNMFWVGPGGAGRFLLPMSSAFMVTLTTGFLWLFLYFLYVNRFEPVLVEGNTCEPSGTGPSEREKPEPSRTPSRSWRSRLGIAIVGRQPQRVARAYCLWERLRSGGPRGAAYRDPGYFTYLATWPVALILTLPILPVLSVAARPVWAAKLGWIAGLVVGLLTLRFIVRRGIQRVSRRVAASRRATSVQVSDRAAAVILIEPRTLALTTIPLLMALGAAYYGDLIHGPLRAVTPGIAVRQPLPTLSFLLGELTLAALLVAGSWRWPIRQKAEYAVVVSSLILLALGLCLFATTSGRGSGLASTFSLCCLLIFLGLVVVVTAGWYGYSPGVGGQALAVAIVLVLLWLNGLNDYKLQYEHLPGYPRSFWGYLLGRGSGLADLRCFDKWLEAEVTATETEGDHCDLTRFGNEDLVHDHHTLLRWEGHARGLRAPSDERLVAGTNPKPKLVVIATSGGALRAAIWTAKVLREIEREIAEFPDRVRLVTGASGGMLGAAYYVTNLGRKEAGSYPESRPVKDQRGRILTIDKQLQQDFWTPALHELVFHDFLTVPCPGALQEDRGRVLEEQWLVHFPSLRRSFHDLLNGQQEGSTTFEGWELPAEKRGELPSLVFTPMLVEDSRRLFISNLRLQDLVFNHGRFDPVTGRDRYEPGPDFPYYSQAGIQMFHLFPLAHATFRVSSAVRMSATFPFISPAVNLPTQPPRSVVDAGYYDNYGVDLAVSWLERHRPWLEEHTSGVVLIQIRAFTNEQRLKRLELERPVHTPLHVLDDWVFGPIGRGAGFLTTPLSGVSRARQYVMSYRNDNAVDGLKRRFTLDKLVDYTGIPTRFCYEDDWKSCYADPKGRESLDHLIEHYDRAQNFLRIITFTCADESPAGGAGAERLTEVETMNWLVSDKEFEEITGKWGTTANRNRFQYLLEIFQRRVVDNSSDEDQTRFEADPDSGWRRRTMLGYGDNHHIREHGAGPKPARWIVTNLPPGAYHVEVTWVEDPRNGSDAIYTLFDGGRPIGGPIRVDQREAPDPAVVITERVGQSWRRIVSGEHIAAPRLVVELSGGTDGRLVADAVRVVPAATRKGQAPRTVDDDRPPFEMPEGWYLKNTHLEGWAFHDNAVYREEGVATPPARWIFENLPPGWYRVYATWPGRFNPGWECPPNATSAATYTIVEGDRSIHTEVVDQRSCPDRAAGNTNAAGTARGDLPNSLGRPWRRLGQGFTVNTGRLVVELNGGAGGRLMADAVRVDRVAPGD